MGKKGKFSWTSALIGAAAATATTAVIFAKPKLPAFRLVSLSALQVKLTGAGAGEKVKFPLIEADLILTVHVTNPNILPVRYSATSLSIYYGGSLLGWAQVPAGSQPANSCQLLRLPARLNGVGLAQHAKRFIGDVKMRKMVLDAEVDISGWAKMILWGPKFKVHVDSQIVVDPVLLDVIDQENVSTMKICVR